MKSFSEQVAELAQDMYTSRPVHPFNITDLFCIAVGATEALIKEELTKHSKDSPLYCDYDARLKAIEVGFRAFQEGTRLLQSE